MTAGVPAPGPPNCECGHPKRTHHPQCIATVYTSGPGGNGMTAVPCQCKRYEETAA